MAPRAKSSPSGSARSFCFDLDRPQQRRGMRFAVAAGLLDRALHPSNGGEIDPELMLQVPARPDRGRLRIERQPDPASLEVLRGADAGARIDENVAVAEHPRGKDRNGHERAIAGAVQADVFGGRQLGDVEFPAPDHAVEDVAAGFERDAVEVDAFDRDVAVADGFHPVIAAAREGQRKTGHGRRLDRENGTSHAARRRVAPATPSRRADQRLENWNERRALALPYFLRSTTRESRVRKPPCLRAPRRSGS